jgi:hypothetical protein
MLGTINSRWLLVTAVAVVAQSIWLACLSFGALWAIVWIIDKT